MFTVASFTAVVVLILVVGAQADWLSLRSLWRLLIRLRDAEGTGLVFALLFVGVGASGLPITPLIVIGGVLFGIWTGMLISWLAAVVAAVIGYYIARRIGRNAVRRLIERMAGRHVQFADKRARRRLLRLRLVPFTPFGALNFAAGLAGMPLRDYVIATAVGIIPSIAIFTYFASQVLSGGKAARQMAIVHTLIAASVLWALTYAPAIWDRFFGNADDADDDDVLPKAPAASAS